MSEQKLPLLFTPFRFKSVTARNRIVVSPMCQYKSVAGSPTNWHMVHMGRYAIGGAGIVFYEETAVEDRGRKTHACAGFYRDEQIPEFRAIADFVREYGAVPAMQLGHSGARRSSARPADETYAAREGEAELEPVSASAVEIEAGEPIPRALSIAEIADLVDAFAASAVRTHQAGFEILEIHGAHGYLIQQFLSPVTNRRNDAYGGDRAGRMRFALEVTEAVRGVWPDDKPLFFRVSSVDGKGGLWSLEDTIALAHELKARGVDCIDCSSGGITGHSTMPAVPRIPGFHLPYARAVKEATGVMTMGPGLITDARQAEEVLQRGDADLVAMARALMYSSEWPVHAARELGAADFYDLFPSQFAARFKLRDAQAQMPQNRPGAVVPTGVNG